MSTATLTQRPVLAKYVDQIIAQLDAGEIDQPLALLALIAADIPPRADLLDDALDAHRHARDLRDRNSDPIAYAEDGPETEWARRNRDQWRDELIARFERDYADAVDELLGRDQARCQTAPCPDHPRSNDGLVAGLGRAVAAASTHIPDGAW